MELADITWFAVLKYVVIWKLFALLWKKREFIRIILRTCRRDAQLIYVMYIKILVGWMGRKRRNQTLCKSLDTMVEKLGPERVCYYFGEETWTFKQLQSMSFRVANYFQAKGFKKGDTVGLLMTNRPENNAIWIGLGRIGVITFMINTNLKGDSLEQSVFSVVRCKAYIIGRETKQAFTEMWLRRKKELQLSEIYEMERFFEVPNWVPNKQTNSEETLPTLDLAECLLKTPANPTIVSAEQQPKFLDPVVYLCTSGTTGVPKAVLCSHGRLSFLASTAAILNLSEKDVTYSAGPLYHISGLAGVLWAVCYGTSTVMVVKFSASNFWKDIHRHKVNVCLYVGEFCRFLCSQPSVNPEKEKGHTIRAMFGGGGMRPEVWAQFQERFYVKEFFDLYTSTEGNCTLLNLEGKIGSCGYIPVWLQRIHPIQLVKVDQITGEICRDAKTGFAIKCADDESGELIGKIIDSIPTARFDGYTDPVATEKKIARNVFRKGDKYFCSGDSMTRDKYGYFYFQDRIGDTFRWKAENVGTVIVEAVISKLTGMKNNVVYGVKVPGTEGSAGMASILDSVEAKLDLQSLAEGMRESLPEYSIPMFIRVMSPIGNGLDMTGTFKFQKFRLREEGFDIKKVEDPIFIYSIKEKIYKELDLQTFKEVMEGRYRF